MKKWLKYLLGSITFTLLLVFLWIGFTLLQVDTRVDINASELTFNNTRSVVRLDSVKLSPDTIHAFVRALMKHAGVQGLAVSIVNDNVLVYQQYFGKRNVERDEDFEPGTIWYAASFSKPILADVVTQLVEEKVMHLDTPLHRYLRKPLEEYHTNAVQHFFGSPFVDYRDIAEDIRWKKITARQCLSHTTGLPNWRWLEPDGKLRFKDEPGARYGYSGEGMYLVQVVLEELTGKSFETLAYEKVFAPLQMTRSSFVWQRAYEGHYAVGHDRENHNLRIPKQNAPNAAGSLSTSLEDYTKFVMAVLRQDTPHYRELISPQVTITGRRQFGMEALVETHDNDSIALGYGLGVGLYTTPYGKVFFKEGHLDGWQHYFVGFPDRKIALVLMANSDQAESIFTSIIEFTTGNTYTPWYWEGYSHDQEKYSEMKE